MTDTPYKRLRVISVKDKLEQKNGLSYLSWAWAVDTLLQEDPAATWCYGDEKRYGETVMVFCSVTAFGKTMTAQLPVMDHRNKAIANPDAFAVNTAMQRALVKAIALHGLGLYVYAGEDLPAAADNTVDPRGDLGKNADPIAVNKTASAMTDLLNADVEEDVKACHIADYHDTIKTNADLYVAASDRLSAKERTAWKAYVKQAAEIARREVSANGRARF